MKRFCVLLLAFYAFAQQGQLPPDFKLANLEGKPVTLAGQRGKATVLTFWASWCTVCKAELPKLHAVAQELGLNYYVISREPRDSLEVVQGYMKKYPAFTPLVALKDGDTPAQVAARWKILGQPWTFVLNTAGKVVAFYAGPVDIEVFKKDLALAAQ